ncbi:hypothetical protein GCM10027034_29820 [Ramlibacter solisilvae]
MASTAAGYAAATAGLPANGDVAELLQLSEESNAALLRGDADRYFALAPLADDFTLMSPFGGKPSRAKQVAEARQSLRQFFKDGTLSVELVQAYSAKDLVVLALIEWVRCAVGGLPAQDWQLRVTLVYRREHFAWRLAHRHADALGPGITLEHAAAIARGEYA